MSSSSHRVAPDRRAAEAVFPAGGEMGRLCRQKDWAATPLGPVESWPQSLKTAAGMAIAQGIAQNLCWGPELIQIYNDAYRAIMRDKHPAGLGRPVLESWVEIRDEVGPLFERVMRGETVYFEDRLLRVERHGRLEDAYFTFSYSPVRVESGEIGAVLINCFETTRQVHARALQAERDRLFEELQVERSRLAEVFRQAPAFLAVVRGPTHVFELVNEAYYRLVGHRKLMGLPVHEALPEVVAQGFVRLLDRVLETGEPLVGRELAVRLARGPESPTEERYVDFVYLPLVEADGTRSGVIAHGIDVTEHVQARREVERLLGESERARADAEATRQRLAFLVDAGERLGSSLDYDATIRHIVSLAVPALADWAAFNVLSPDGSIRTLAIHHPDPEMEALAARINERYPMRADAPVGVAKVLRTGEPELVREIPDELLEAAAQDAEHLAMLRSIGFRSMMNVPLVSRGRVLGALGFASGHSGRLFGEQDLEFALELARRAAVAIDHAILYAEAQAARHDAETANRAKADFLASMSHELRTPLNAIGGYAELLEMGLHGPVTPAQRDALGRIAAGQRHLLTLINDVLAFAKLEAGQIDLDLRVLEAAPLLSSVEQLVAPLAQAKGIALSSECDPELRLRGDAERVRQVLLNLVGNAIKFTQEGGHVGLACRRRGTALEIEVRDDGPGIARDQQEAIFDPFIQVDRRLSSPREGVGLGLAISRDLARAMGGELGVESEPGVGSVFTLRLPAADPGG